MEVSAKKMEAMAMVQLIQFLVMSIVRVVIGHGSHRVAGEEVGLKLKLSLVP